MADLKIKGIGKETKRRLELILEKGLEDTMKILAQEKEDRLQRMRMRSVMRRSGDDIPPSWDNTVKVYEGN